MIRNINNGKCIPIDTCHIQLVVEQKNLSANICDENEHFSEMNAGCQLSCYTYFNDARNERCHSEVVDSAGCVCNENYVRDTKTGKCIEISKCASKVIQFLLAINNPLVKYFIAMFNYRMSTE